MRNGPLRGLCAIGIELTVSRLVRPVQREQPSGTTVTLIKYEALVFSRVHLLYTPVRVLSGPLIDNYFSFRGSASDPRTTSSG